MLKDTVESFPNSMSEPYLLLASLLSSSSVAAPPSLPILPWEQGWSKLNVINWIKLPKSAAQAYPGSVDTSPPEFSTTQATTVTRKPTIPTSFNQRTKLAPHSGSQLYQQRKAALRAGQLYTRLATDSFYPAWSKAKQQPTHQQWQKLLAREAQVLAYGQGNNQLGIILGDSLSMWFPSQLLPSGKFWLNQGISGENSGQILTRLPTLQANQPNTIYVMAGINDLRQGASDRVILHNIRSIMGNLRQSHPQAYIIVQSILPTRNHPISNQRIRNLNRQIMLIAQEEGVSYLNLYPLFRDEQNQMRPELTTDGIHLSRQGYQVWQAALNHTESLIALR